MWRAAASLERLDVKPRKRSAQRCCSRSPKSPVPTYGFWALTRLGARVLLYGPLNAVVHPQVVERWLDATARLPAGQRERTERLGVLPAPAGPRPASGPSTWTTDRERAC